MGRNVTVGWRELDGERALCLYSLFVSSFFFIFCVSSLFVRVASLVRSFLLDKTGQVFCGMLCNERSR